VRRPSLWAAEVVDLAVIILKVEGVGSGRVLEAWCDDALSARDGATCLCLRRAALQRVER
jgi:hypothetical protein